MGLPFGFVRSSAATSLLVTQMAVAIQRFSRLVVALERANGTSHRDIAGH
jgi:hypothetical protein